MREIVLDTETTGFNPDKGDRVVEIGCIELDNMLPTGEVYHVYINPERPMPEAAFRVHGLSDEFLRDKPVFADIAADFMAFVGESQLIIHNASFDMRFLNFELTKCGGQPLPDERAIDTLEMARKKHPFGPNSLDALCRRYGIDNSNRDYHGALLDSELLAQVYLELRGGRQPGLVLDSAPKPGSSEVSRNHEPTLKARPRPLSPRLSPAEAVAHRAMIDELGEKAVWNRYCGPDRQKASDQD
ncbi:MAG: DNA polymerase III subunit epsilon [Hyphomicrobiales bacterium]|nr:MAG: DNA polymerase III subunit epsilon [Hyphomicrobiales bacterium]